MMQHSDPELNSVPHARRAWTGSTLPGQIPLSSVGDFLAVNQHPAPPTQWLSLEVFVVGGWGGSSHAGDPNVFCFMLQREPLDAPKLHVACSNQLMLSLVFSSPFFTYPTLSFFLSLFSQSPPSLLSVSRLSCSSLLGRLLYTSINTYY